MPRKSPGVIDPVEVDLAVERYMTCRLVGHTWQIVEPGDHEHETQFGMWMLVLRCPNCTTERVDAFDARGEVMNRRYLHPEDYKAAEPVYRPEVRRMWVTTQVEGSRRRNQRRAS